MIDAHTPIRVLVCDDSLTIRNAITRMLRAEPTIEVVSVRDGQAAIDIVRARRQAEPIDIVVLDIEMPVMNGLMALPLLRAIDPSVRIIMASTLTLRGARVTLDALALGAADYVPKPSAAGGLNDAAFRDELIAKVRGLGRLRRRELAPALPSRLPAPVTAMRLPAPPLAGASRPGLLAIGSSTGGPQALFAFFKALGPSLGIPVVLTQHMPASFVPMLAEQITRLGGMTCREAEHGEPLRPDHVAVAPGGRHLTVQRDTNGLAVALSDAPPENFCRPSVDVMLRSTVPACGGRVLVVMLTGMGRDGLAGTRAIVDAGGSALAQDEDSSVVWGMPGAIANAGLCRAVLPLSQLPGAVRELAGT